MSKIRILFIHHALVCGGAEQALFDLCCLLDPAKFDISVLVQRPGGIWEQKFRDAGIRVIDVWDCQTKSKKPFVKLQNYIKRKKLIHCLHNDCKGLIDTCFGKAFDVIVSYNIWNTHYIGLSRYAKTVKYIHGDVGTNIDYKKNIQEISDILPHYDYFVCVSDAARASFETLTGISDNVGTYLNPLNSQSVHELAKVNISLPQDEPVICAIGRLAPEKGFDRLIRIHKEILELNIPHKLVIVGDGLERENLENIINETNTENSVIMVGYTPNPYPYMKNCRFMVCSSYTEGLPVIAMEALSLGVPIVSSVPSIGELFGDSLCGVITQNDDASLKEGIIHMLCDQDFYLAAKACAEQRSHFLTGKNMVSKVEELFIKLTDSI